MTTEFNTRLKELRKAKGITQAELAAQIGVGRTTVAEYEKGSIMPAANRLLEIARIFGVSVDDLTGSCSTPEDAAHDVLDTVHKLMQALDVESGITFDGKPITSATRELLKASLANSLALSRLTQNDNKN